MKNESKLVLGSFQLIRNDFGLTDQISSETSVNTFEQLHDVLTPHVQYLLDYAFERLINALYRIDLSEEKVKAILNFEKPEKIASSLARAIIDREKSKMITRMAYSERK